MEVKSTPAIIDLEKCDGCGNCIEACPSEAISIGDDGKAMVNEEDCVECESCVDECPNDALSMDIIPVIGIVKV